jgi:pimeloyl-ACP methyl ester carboxylesterase
MPVLSVLGERSDQVSPVSREAHELVLTHAPQAESFVLPRATHFLQLHNPSELAEEIARFIGSHPV